jgi:Tfp pilus assembly PilM family ATPase
VVDITDEASEIGIIRDGSLTYSTHTPFGMFSLARELSNCCEIPLHEALGYLRAPTINEVMKHLPESRHEEIRLIFKAYTERLTELLKETGDSLSIPKKILLHVEASFVPLFSTLLSTATHRATRVDHLITPVSDLITDTKQRTAIKERLGDYAYDTALLLHAEFFHKQQHCLDFQYV